MDDDLMNCDEVIKAAQKSKELADEVAGDPMRCLDCRCMLAAVKSAFRQDMGFQWRESEQFVAEYNQRATDPPRCVLKQQLLVRKAADAEANVTRSGQDRSEAQAKVDDLRVEAVRTGPQCDVHCLIEAATALATRGGRRHFGTDALDKVSHLAKSSSSKAVHFLLDNSGSMAGTQIK